MSFFKMLFLIFPLHNILLLLLSRSLSRVQLFLTPWTVAYQAPQSMEFSRQEYYFLPFPSPMMLLNVTDFIFDYILLIFPEKKIFVGIPWSLASSYLPPKISEFTSAWKPRVLQSRTTLNHILTWGFPRPPSGYTNLAWKSAYSLACGHNFFPLFLFPLFFLFSSSMHSSKTTFPAVSFWFTLRV